MTTKRTTGKDSNTPETVATQPQETPKVKGKDLKLPFAIGNKCIVSVGDLFCFMTHVNIMITSIFLSGVKVVVKGLICEVEQNIVTHVHPLTDCEITCLPSLLSKTSVTMSNKIKSMANDIRRASHTEINTSYQGNCHDFAYVSVLEKMKLAKVLRSFCREVLTGKALKRSLSLIDNPTYAALFDINISEKKVKEFRVNDFSKLDEIMGLMWDVLPEDGESNNHFHFISSLSVKFVEPKIEFTFCKSISHAPLRDDYRAVAVSSLYTAEDK